MSSNSSFYTDGETYSTSYTAPGDVPGATTASQAPSSFYPAGETYAQANPDAALNYANQAAASASAAATSASNASASASAAATSASNAASAVQSAAGTATPLMDGAAAVGTGTHWAHEDHVHPTDTTRAPVASPTFTGTPAAPTAAADTNTAQLASTAFVLGQAASANPVMDGTAAPGTSTRFARADHVHPTDTTRAPLASPGFTGTPTAPTPAVNDSSTKIATTAYVEGQASSANPVMDGTAAPGTGTKWAREDHVHPTDTTRAPLASPALTGTPTAPTAAVGTNTTQLATTAFVLANGSSGVQGQCKLALSVSNLLLSPKNGNLLTINGVNYAVPDAGVSLAPTGLTASTTYFIYAYMNAGVMTLEASTTGHATSTTTGNKGVEIKSADDTRTLVGMARCITGPAWIDSSAQIGVLSYFNRKNKRAVNHLTAARSVSATSFTEFNSEIRTEFLTWADETVDVKLAGSGYVNVTSHAIYFALAFDGTSPEDGMASISDAAGAGSLRPLGLSASESLSEGDHYATAVGAVDSTTGSPAATLYFASAANGQRSAIYVTVRG